LANEKAQAAISEAENYRKLLANDSDVQATLNKNQEGMAHVTAIEEQLKSRIQQLENDLEDNRHKHEVSKLLESHFLFGTLWDLTLESL
jgi:uncharacterized protein YhbP (UPF0306 family)